jgi:hypothetical protein
MNSQAAHISTDFPSANESGVIINSILNVLATLIEKVFKVFENRLHNTVPFGPLSLSFTLYDPVRPNQAR